MIRKLQADWAHCETINRNKPMRKYYVHDRLVLTVVIKAQTLYHPLFNLSRSVVHRLIKFGVQAIVLLKVDRK